VHHGCEEEYMRALDCDCGEHLEAADDEALTRKVQNHMEQSHPDTQLSEEEARSLVSDKAYTSDPQDEGMDVRGHSGA